MTTIESPVGGFAIIDTETSGLFDFKKPADAEGQPRLCELCIIRVTPDLQVENEYQRYIKPDGWGMSGEAEEANGITEELLEEHGVPVAEVLDEYEKLVAEGRTFIAFGAQFDMKVLRGELRRAGRQDHFEECPNICVMRKAAPLCNLPWPSGRAGYKWPKLSEALTYFSIPYTGPLGAVRDARAAFEIFKALVEKGYAGEARVHYAKNRPVA